MIGDEIMKRARVAVFPKGFLEDLVEGRMDLFHWIDLASTLNADGLEMYPLFLKDRSLEGLKKVKEAASRGGLTIPMMCASPDFTHPSRAFRDDEVEKMREIIEVTAILGPDDGCFCRVLSGQRRPEVDVDEGVLWTVEAIRQLLPFAAEHGVKLVMENHYKDGFWTYPEFALRQDVFLRIVNQIDSPWFGVNYDPSNAIVAGDNPLTLLQMVKHRVFTMHASDRYLLPGFRLEDVQAHFAQGYSTGLAHGVIGQGLNDYDAIFSELQSVHFASWISIEDGINGLDEMRQSVDFVKAKIEAYL